MIELNPLVSVIIPFYNSEEFLDMAIESVLGQTYENIELIIVNDGSTDNSEQIAKKYHEQDIRCVIYTKENGGVSSARNFGIDHANGEYIMFIDSDDWIEEDTISNLLSKLMQDKSDMIVYGVFFDSYRNNKLVHSQKKAYHSIVLYEREDIAKFYNELKVADIFASCCNKIFLSVFIKNNKIRFADNISNYEDYLFVVDAFSKAEKISISSTAYYHYIKSERLGNSRKYKENYTSNILYVIQKADLLWQELGLKATAHYTKIRGGYAYMLSLCIENICKKDVKVKNKLEEIKKLTQNEFAQGFIKDRISSTKFTEVFAWVFKRKMVIFLWGLCTFKNMVKKYKY